MGSDKQNSVKISQEHKAVLAAMSGLTHSTKVDCNPQSIKELVSGGLMEFQEHVMYNHENGLEPSDVGMNFYMLYDDEDSTKMTALMNRLPKEIKDRDIFVDEDVDIQTVDVMHQLFGSDWVVQTGKFKGHSFSYSGIDGKEKLVYSQAIDYALKELSYDVKPKTSVEITAEPKGEYLKDDDTLIFIMCKVKKSNFEPETGLTKVYFTWYELIINISSKKATSAAGGKGHFYSDRGSEIQMEKERSREIDFDLEL